MATKTFYEWDIEEFDPETDDIIDHNHSDDFPGIPEEDNYRLVLVRDTWEHFKVYEHGKPMTEIGDLIERQWAYVENGSLPEEFTGGSVVPKRFHKMVCND